MSEAICDRIVHIVVILWIVTETHNPGYDTGETIVTLSVFPGKNYTDLPLKGHKMAERFTAEQVLEL